MKKGLFLIIIAFVQLFVISCSDKQDSSAFLEKQAVLYNRINNSTETIKESNILLYNEFDKHYMLLKNRVENIYAKVLKNRHITDLLIERIEAYKLYLLDDLNENDAIFEEKGIKKIDILKLENPENTEIVNKRMIEDGGGQLIKDKLNDYREYIYGLLKEEFPYFNNDLNQVIKKALNTDDGINRNEEIIPWDYFIFQDNNVVGTLIVLSQIQNDIRIVESLVLNYLYKQLIISDVPFNRANAFVSSETESIPYGKDYSAEIFLAQYDSVSQPKVYIGNYDTLTYRLIGKEGVDWWMIDSVKNGKATYFVSKPSKGIHAYNGIIVIETIFGSKIYPFKAGYKVGVK